MVFRLSLSLIQSEGCHLSLPIRDLQVGSLKVLSYQDRLTIIHPSKVRLSIISRISCRINILSTTTTAFLNSNNPPFLFHLHSNNLFSFSQIKSYHKLSQNFLSHISNNSSFLLLSILNKTEAKICTRPIIKALNKSLIFQALNTKGEFKYQTILKPILVPMSQALKLWKTIKNQSKALFLTAILRIVA
jgi:hypothetical protein